MDFKDLELNKNDEFKLESIEVGLTSDCNFHCDYCCAYRKDNDQLLPAKNIIKIIEKLPDLKRVKLSGGEVLIYYAECLSLVEYCKRRKLHIQINTNGGSLNKDQIFELEKAGLDTLHFSLNFSTSRDFKEFHKLEESLFDAIVNNIKTSVKTKINTIVEAVLFKNTEKTIVNTCDFIYTLGVRKIEIQYGISVKEIDGYNITRFDKVEAIIRNLIRTKREDCEMYFSCFGEEMKDVISRNIYEKGVYFPSCIEGKKQLHLHCNGDILICELGYPVKIGNVFEGTELKTILTNVPENLKDFHKNHNCRKLLKSI